jgi:hypothetical protein
VRGSSSLTPAPFNQSGSPFKIPAGAAGEFFDLSNTVGEGTFINESTVTSTSYAFDQSELIVVPITYPTGTVIAF